MRRLSHPLFALILACMLVLTGNAMATARAMPGPSGAMELCTGTGPITVLVDADGQPVGAPHICPDCALSLFAATPVGTVLPARGPPRRIASCPDRGATNLSRAVVVARARGPPRPV